MNKQRKKAGPKAVVLLSGGLDSTTTLYEAKRQGYDTVCLTFDYGQRHKKEIRRAEKIARLSGSVWQLVRFGLPWKGSSLLDRSMRVPKNRSLKHGIPSTYVPGRNIIFLSIAASFAECIGARAIFIGANEIDFSGYPDCRQEFLRAFEQALRKGTKQGVEGSGITIHAPLLKKNKARIVAMAERLGVPVRLTWSCYQGGKQPCGTCDSCRLRRQGFIDAGMPDPAI
ncbi:MAG: 7-cyano-7-deazaguanine synthase QueC [Candidatus Omnitrophica bacterium]|nr:7-cyano-7-deazaguanine synthase QueC [Candidatus Omnitrophota bacterium]